MSTAGSGRSGDSSSNSPGASGAPPETTTKRRRTAIFRWRGIIPIILALAVIYLGWRLFAERLIRATLVEAGTKALGTEFDLDQVKLHELQPGIELRGLAVADPFDPKRNLFEAKVVSIMLEYPPLFEKKIAIRSLTIGDVRTNTTRATPAKPVPAGGFAPNAMHEMEKWAKQFEVPLLSLTPVDTIKSIILDPKQLKSVQAALGLGLRVDSARATLEKSYAGLHLQETLDSSRALAASLQSTNVRTLGVDGARTKLADVRRALARVDSAKRRVEALASVAKGGIDSLQNGLRLLDSARKNDYAFARGLLKLPSLNAPDIGAALFGKVTIDKFQQALYWSQLARKYAPPGLLPKESEGPKRLRMAGTTVHFVKPLAYPRFLLRRADVNVTVSDGAARGAYAMTVADATSDPSLVGRPTLFSLRRKTTGTALDSLRVSASLDHVTTRAKDVLAVQAAGIALPSLPLPMLPYRADPGRGASELRLTLDGDQVSASWSVHSNALSWIADSARTKTLNTMESLVAKVITGVGQLELNASLSGPVSAPKLSVNSNLDRAVADRLKSMMGAEVASAEARVRARVDSLVDEKAAPVQKRIADLKTDGDKRIADARTQLDAEKQKLEAQVKALSGGLIGLPKLP